jgi:chromosome segregation ATPase
MSKTIRNYFIIGIACLLIGAGITGIIVGKQLHSLRESEAATVAALAELERQNQELASNFGAIKAGLDRCTSAVTSVQGSIQQLNGKIQNLGTVMESIKSDIGQVTARQSDFSAELSRFGSAVSGLGQSIHGLAEPIHSATTGVQQAAGELSGADSLIEQAASILHGLPSAGSQGTK